MRRCAEQRAEIAAWIAWRFREPSHRLEGLGHPGLRVLATEGDRGDLEEEFPRLGCLTRRKEGRFAAYPLAEVLLAPITSN